MRNDIKLKICGMTFPHNMRKVAQIKPDYLGFIFYEKSPRCMVDTLGREDLKQLPRRTQKVGVFVNASTKYMQQQAKTYGLNLLQLHGSESPAQCEELKKAGHQLVKVFSLGKEDFDFALLETYKPFVKYFLFDTKGKQPGGNGETFDWSLLRHYDQEVPFFLSGGVSLENVVLLKDLHYLNIHAIDVNSQFEVEPGLKDLDLLQKLKDQMRT